MSTHTPAKRIGFIATGSEIISGEILNTNGQKMAQAMMSYGMQIGEHIVVDDDESNMQRALQFMLQHHDVVITSGGLGPTSDDRTRFIVADIANQPLVFNEASWQRIETRLAKRNMPIPESNKQQAYFPENATIFINDNGTADGCHVPMGSQHVFMLPGPPRECLPLFHNDVLPALERLGCATDQRLYRWRLMGVSESVMAEQLEQTVGHPFGITLAYRAAYPYLDIKVQLAPDPSRHEVLDAIQKEVAPYLVTTEHSNVSTQLKDTLADFDGVISLCDQATKGQLLAELTTPQTHAHVMRIDEPEQLPKDFAVLITGLETYWQPQANVFETFVEVTLSHQGQVTTERHPIFLRGQSSMNSAIEFCCFAIMKRWFS